MKRPHMPLSVKLEAAIRQLGLDPADVEFDHDPALEMRQCDYWHDGSGMKIIYRPDANDPRYIVIRSKADHKRKTFGTGKPREGDIKTIAHTRRLTKKEEAFRQRLLAKTKAEDAASDIPGKGSWQGFMFIEEKPVRKPKIKSRGFPKRGKK